MHLEEWFDKYQFEVQYDIGESGVKYFKLRDLDLDLDDVELRYTQHLGNPKLREVIARSYDNLSWENIAVTTGAAESIFSIIASLTNRNDHIIIECPNYPSFWYIPESLERQMDLFFLEIEDKFKPNINTLEEMIKPNTKLICLTHPNNPTGSTITEEELKQIIDMVEERNIFLLLDETYRDLSLSRLPPSTAASLSENAVSVSTMSKVFGVPGIRIGWSACRDEKVILGILKVREQKTICNSAINEAIALQLLAKKKKHLVDIKNRVSANYAILINWMKDRVELEFVAPEGGVTCFPKFSKSTRDLCQLLVEKYKTFTVPGYCFHMDRYFRIGFGGDSEELKNGLEKLEAAFRELR
jgi:aspartate/methionine/tyrosine aminotransferase